MQCIVVQEVFTARDSVAATVSAPVMRLSGAV